MDSKEIKNNIDIFEFKNELIKGEIFEKFIRWVKETHPQHAATKNQRYFWKRLFLNYINETL